METDIKVLTELADKILKQADIQIRYNGIFNLQNKIGQDFNQIISACRDLISENSKLRFSDYLIYYYNINSNHNFANRCLRLCMNHSDSLTEYENEPDEKWMERRQKINQYDGVITIEGKSPDLIYCENGSYRIFNNVCQSFEYRLCREIQKSGINNDELKTIFQIVCLDIALRNELRIIKDEASLLGISLGHAETKCQTVLSPEAAKFRRYANKIHAYNEAIEDGRIIEEENYIRWVGRITELSTFLTDNGLVRENTKDRDYDWASLHEIFIAKIRGRDKVISSSDLRRSYR